MVNKLYIVVFLFLVGLSSCTLKESIQRDVLAETDSAGVNIPVSTNLVDTLNLLEINSSANLDAVISSAGEQFTVEDLKSAKLTKFSVVLDKPDSINNFSAFAYLKLEINSPALDPLEIAIVNNNSTQAAPAINFTIQSNKELLEYFRAGNFTYIISGVTRTATTEIMKAKAVAGYKLTLGI